MRTQRFSLNAVLVALAMAVGVAASDDRSQSEGRPVESEAPKPASTPAGFSIGAPDSAG